MAIKIILACLCVYGALGTPLSRQAYEIFDDVENDAEIIDAAEPLPGSKNLQEKRLPVIRLTIPAGYLGAIGQKNLGERSQVPYHQALLPGVRNLDEKSLPESVVARMNGQSDFTARHPKSEVEKVVL